MRITKKMQHLLEDAQEIAEYAEETTEITQDELVTFYNIVINTVYELKRAQNILKDATILEDENEIKEYYFPETAESKVDL